MREAERGFTLVETAVTMGIVAVLLAAGGAWLLAMRPGALMHATSDYDAALASARGIAITSGNGATLVFAPRSGGVPGFALRAYSGRPASAGAVIATTVMPVDSDATVTEATLGAPPFAIFIGASGHASGKAAYPSIDARGNATFPVVANEPGVPARRLRFHLYRSAGRSCEAHAAVHARRVERAGWSRFAESVTDAERAADDTGIAGISLAGGCGANVRRDRVGIHALVRVDERVCVRRKRRVVSRHSAEAVFGRVHERGRASFTAAAGKRAILLSEIPAAPP